MRHQRSSQVTQTSNALSSEKEKEEKDLGSERTQFGDHSGGEKKD